MKTWTPSGPNLIDDLSEAVAGSGNPRRCSVCVTLARLDSDERQSLQEALNSKLGAKRLSLILQKHGMAVGVPSIHLHRSEGHQP
jgi:hypothetical protein